MTPEQMQSTMKHLCSHRWHESSDGDACPVCGERRDGKTTLANISVMYAGNTFQVRRFDDGEQRVVRCLGGEGGVVEIEVDGINQRWNPMRLHEWEVIACSDGGE